MQPGSATEQDSSELRDRIVAAASALIAQGGSDAATTRAVALEAGVQPPAIYRLFGDKTGLLAAVAEHELTRYINRKDARSPHPDPIEDLRIGWDGHVEFCLANPGLFAILSGEGGPASDLGTQVLRRQIRRIAEAGRLVTTEERALSAVHAAGTGTIVALLSQSPQDRDSGLSAFTRDMVIDALTRAAPAGTATDDMRPQATAVALKTLLDRVDGLSPGERLMLEELLERIALARPGA